jgi:hypothetical protein
MEMDFQLPIDIPPSQIRKADPLTDHEKCRITEPRNASVSWRRIGRTIDRPHLTGKGFSEKWEIVHKFSLEMRETSEPLA